MAFRYNGSTQSLDIASGVIPSLPLTIAGWFNADTTATMTIGATAHTTEFAWLVLVSGKVWAQYRSALNATATAATTAGFSTGVWNHGAGVFTSDSARTVYLNGSNAVTDTVLASGGFTPSNTNIATLERATKTAHMDGLLAEVGFWDVALTSKEIAALGDGVSPLMVRPQNLVAYAPQVNRGDAGLSPVGNSFTPVNTPVYADHPRVIYPSAKIYSFPSAGGGAATPLYDEYYRTLLSGSMM